jgi:hypothetical protein
MAASLSALLQARRRVLRVLHGAFLVAPAAYLAVAWMAASGREAAATGPPAFVLIILGLAAVGAAGVSLVLPRILLDEIRLEATLGDAPAPAGVDPHDESGRRSLALAGVYQNARVVGWAAAETVAILGLVLVLLGGPLWHYVVFAGLSLVLIVQAPPRLDAFLRDRGGPTGEV